MPATVPKWLKVGVPPTLIYFAPLGPSLKYPSSDKPRSRTMSLARMMESNSNSPRKRAVILRMNSLSQARSTSTDSLRSYVITASPAASP